MDNTPYMFYIVFFIIFLILYLLIFKVDSGYILLKVMKITQAFCYAFDLARRIMIPASY